MHTGTSQIDEISTGERAARIFCASNLVPAPGKYLLAWALSEPDTPLPAPVFLAETCPGGFYAAAPLPVAWIPGTTLHLTGPLGRGFHLPAIARRVVLVSLGATPARLLALIRPALAQGASVSLLCANPPANLPLAVEILPPDSLTEMAAWADYLALDLPRERLPELALAALAGQTMLEVLLETPLPCGGLGECGVCAVVAGRKIWLACKDGPVFEGRQLI
ncbi:MAG: hypothetical protein CO094_03855 [Anaerolineae bacterium CG_4_9_14_3_um_filter_57_17]|nr:hypothetical protein [bacterium]NCT20169.1 hypothetical protein [bacterium]OIO86890.1 MAG: hypothetical protein AUK01_01625 [Anaerolineae bacterium CG2_30_57_67]PJB67488.1 MAG: hypothetical protein CO094_03855 [Anaerolineae bacterium CG_4_9_14_3_um_filter_57_17]